MDYIKKQKGGFDPESTLIFLHEPYDKDTYTTFVPPKFVEHNNDLGLIITKCYSPEDQGEFMTSYILPKMKRNLTGAASYREGRVNQS